MFVLQLNIITKKNPKIKFQSYPKNGFIVQKYHKNTFQQK